MVRLALVRDVGEEDPVDEDVRDARGPAVRTIVEITDRPRRVAPGGSVPVDLPIPPDLQVVAPRAPGGQVVIELPGRLRFPAGGRERRPTGAGLHAGGGVEPRGLGSRIDSR